MSEPRPGRRADAARTGEDARDDATLVGAYLMDGDVGAFGALYQRHRDRVVRIAAGIVPDRDTALDVAQDVFVRLGARLGDWRHDAAFTTWLHRITVNACLDRLRQRSPVPVAEVASHPQADVESGDPASAIDVRRALAALDPDQRAAVVLHDMIGYRYDEIAEICAVPVGTVRSRISRGRTRLSELLSPEHGNQPGTA